MKPRRPMVRSLSREMIKWLLVVNREPDGTWPIGSLPDRTAFALERRGLVRWGASVVHITREGRAVADCHTGREEHGTAMVECRRRSPRPLPGLRAPQPARGGVGVPAWPGVRQRGAGVMRAGTARLGNKFFGYAYRGVLRDDGGAIVWTCQCSTPHANRSISGSRFGRSALACAEAEMARRDGGRP